MKQSILELGTPLTKEQQSKVNGGNVKLCDHNSQMSVWMGGASGYYVQFTHSNGEVTKVSCTEQQMKSMCGW